MSGAQVAAEISDKLSHDEVDYVMPSWRDETCTMCVHFIEPDACELVESPIDGAGYCIMFDRYPDDHEMREKWDIALARTLAVDDDECVWRTIKGNAVCIKGHGRHTRLGAKNRASPEALADAIEWQSAWRYVVALTNAEVDVLMRDDDDELSEHVLHLGPGPHPSGSDQGVHGHGGGGSRFKIGDLVSVPGEGTNVRSGMVTAVRGDGDVEIETRNFEKLTVSPDDVIEHVPDKWPLLDVDERDLMAAWQAPEGPDTETFDLLRDPRTAKGKAFAALLKKMPRYEGTIYRGTQLTPNDLKKIANRSGYTVTKHVSASKDEPIAEEFMQGVLGNEGVTPAILVFKVKRSGADIEEYLISDFKLTREVVVEAGSRFKVRSYEPRTVDFDGRRWDYTRITLEEQ